MNELITIYDKDSEECIIGLLLSHKTAFAQIAGRLEIPMFYAPETKGAFETAQKLFSQGKPIGLITMRDLAPKLPEGKHMEFDWLVDIADRGIITRITEYVRIIKSKWLNREMRKIGIRLIEQSKSIMCEPVDVLSDAEQDLLNLHIKQVGQIVRLSDGETVPKAIADIKLKIEQSGTKSVTGIDTGIRELNKVLGGWQDSDLIVLGGRPAMGKTAFALHLATAAAKQGKKVGFFSLEMSSRQLLKRLIATEAKINGSKLNTGRDIYETEWNSIEIAGEVLQLRDILIDDSAGLTLVELRARAIRMQIEFGIDFIILDYIQLMHGNGKGSRHQEVGANAQGLKELAKSLDIPILALAQLSRKVEDRGGDKRPQMADLKESGDIEQAADIVALMYRAEYYGLTHYDDATSTEGIAEILIVKHRNGATATVKTEFIKHTGEFGDMGFKAQPEFKHENDYADML